MSRICGRTRDQRRSVADPAMRMEDAAIPGVMALKLPTQSSFPKIATSLAMRVLNASSLWWFLLRRKLSGKNRMQRPFHRFILIPSRHPTFWRPASIAFAIAFHALLVCGLSMGGTATVAEAQPAASKADFKPAKPVPKVNKIPPYPPNSMLQGEEGSVQLKLTIAANGRVSDARIERSSGSRTLDRTTVGWIKSRWRFFPATLNGQPVTSTITLSVRFVLMK